jgi:hypothetical protein
VPDGTPLDFVDLLRNVGEPPDPSKATGGTYGFGKAALYLASAARTLLVYTRCQHAGKLESRFIATAIGGRYSLESGTFAGKYTGRHWWGRLDGGIAEPILDDEADDLATELGLPAFRHNETGTTIGIIDPIDEPAFDEDSVRSIQEAILWFFWPKMLASDGEAAPITFSGSFDEADLPVPAPADLPPLSAFVDAYHAVKDFSGEVSDPGRRVTAIKRRSERVGVLAIHRVPIRTRQPFPGSGGRKPYSPKPVGSPARHVALMRAPELIVKYEAGTPLPSDDVEYVGVFIADPKADKAFAASEPPAHDLWEPAMVPTPEHRSVVKVSLDKISVEMRAMAEPVRPGPESGREVALGAISDELAVLIPATEGTGGGPERTLGSGGPKRLNVRIRSTGAPVFRVVDGRDALVTSFEVLHRPGSAGSRVWASAGVMLDDGSMESALDTPANADVPELIGWVDPEGTLLRQEEIMLSADRAGAWQVVTTVVGDASIGLVVEGEAFEDAKTR